MKLLLPTILSFWIISVLAGEPSLTAERLGDNVYELELITDQTADVAIAQRALLPAAQQLCVGKTARFGHYKFESVEPVPGQPTAPPQLTLRQQVHCDLASAPAPAVQAASLAPHDDQVIEALTMKYLAARDAGNYAKAYGLFGTSMKESTSLESWSNSARDLSTKAGRVTMHKIKKITWYDNPPSAAPGTYAAADYESESENARIHCGYVAWHGNSDGSFQIVREEQNFIDREAAEKIAPEQLKSFADRFGCEVRQ